MDCLEAQGKHGEKEPGGQGAEEEGGEDNQHPYSPIEPAALRSHLFSKKRCGAALLPHTYRPLSFNLSLGHVCQVVVGWSQVPIRANDAKFRLSIREIREAVVQVP